MIILSSVYSGYCERLLATMSFAMRQVCCALLAIMSFAEKKHAKRSLTLSSTRFFRSDSHTTSQVQERNGHIVSEELTNPHVLEAHASFFRLPPCTTELFASASL